MSSSDTNRDSASRRDFLKATTVAAGAALVSNLVPAVHAAGSDQIKVGVIGCGGRGSGAADNVLHAAKNVSIVALGDVFKFQVDGLRNRLTNLGKSDAIKQKGNSVDVEGRCFVGLDAYKQVIDSGANYIILATTPGFRPIHLQAAVAAGKNIFTEKPVGVDGPGIRKVLEAAEEAQKKGLHIVAGTQRRHQRLYVETMKRIHDGAIGDIVAGRDYWMQGLLWQRISELPKHPEITTEVGKQIFNWYNHTWLCGDHIVEQHVHNIDVLNWAIGAHPESAVGMGFRTRTDPRFGHIYDFFAIDYKFPKDVHTLSMCRQISNCASEIGEYMVGTKGTCHTADRHTYLIDGKPLFTRKELKEQPDPYVQEHTDLIESIRSGKPINELKRVAESTLTAIMGRMSAYTGKQVSWEQALNSKEDTMPKDLTWDMQLSEAPVAIPGKTPLI
ncbi:MAG TPA: Gfo/Idh/MocA family oxidoreductase [Gemmataceae bacterium]|nr:Gfo/Idh/MocA family oxidoreductase [Gemmataceae bacterium]